MTTLEEALVKHQNLSPTQLDLEWTIAKALPCQVAAPVRNLQESDNRKTARFVQMALLAGKEAMEQSKLIEWLDIRGDDDDDEYNHCSVRNRFGVSIGSGMSGVREIIQASNIIMGGAGGSSNDEDNNIASSVSIRRLPPHFIPKVLTNSASGRLSLEYGLRGPNLSPSTACAAGSHAIGEAFRSIQYGTADIYLAGGAEASIEPIGMAGFCRLRALSTGFPPELSSRPFDVQRDGFVMGEGAGVLVLEELEHAKDRGANILAEICGYGLSGDAFHITAPDENGRGAERAMVMALDDAGMHSREKHSTMSDLTIGYINAHATSTPRGDDVEAMVRE
jgi:3-oxoacyl-[acyl-carrier-protein] synthase II